MKARSSAGSGPAAAMKSSMPLLLRASALSGFPQGGDRVALRQQAQPLQGDIGVDCLDDRGALREERGQPAGGHHLQRAVMFAADAADDALDEADIAPEDPG